VTSTPLVAAPCQPQYPGVCGWPQLPANPSLKQVPDWERMTMSELARLTLKRLATPVARIARVSGLTVRGGLARSM